MRVTPAAAFHRPAWDWRPWLSVLGLELVNEAWDLLQPFYPTDEGNNPASLHDLWITMPWPAVPARAG